MIHVSAYIHGTHKDNEANLQLLYIELKLAEYFWTQVGRLNILVIKTKICVSIRKSEVDVSDTPC